MNLDKIITSASAICALQFQKEIQSEANRLTREENLVPVWAFSKAIENKTPDLIASMLKLVLSDFLVELNRENH